MTNQQKDNIYISIAIIIAGIIIAGAIVYNPKSEKGIDEKMAAQVSAGERQANPSVSVSSDDHIRGDKDAPVTIVEFSDFQCPFCKRFHPTVKQVLGEYSKEVRWVYKHFPLDSIHPQARPAAEASECAAEQDKFWEFTDGLFENQSRLGGSLYKELAQDIGLNVNKFESCLSSGKYKDKVEADLQEGIKLGVNGTPGGFVNGEQIAGAVSYGTLKTMVEQALSDLE